MGHTRSRIAAALFLCLALGGSPALAQSAALAVGQRLTGRLEASDPRTTDGNHYDEFSYAAQAGERVVIEMTSTDFDAFLRWGRGAAAAFQPLTWDDDGGGGTDARLEVVAEDAGTYVIRATSYGADALGAYTLGVSGTGIPSEAPAVTAGQSVDGRLDATDRTADDGALYDLYAYAGSAGERLEITMSSGEFDTYLSWGPDEDALESHNDDDDGTNSRLEVTIPFSGSYVIRAKAFGPGQTGRYTLRVERTREAGLDPSLPADPSPTSTSSGPAVRAARPIASGQSVDERLEEDDPRAPEGAYYHRYLYSANAGERLVITMRSPDFDTYLSWGRADGDYVQHDDDGGGGTDSRLEVTAPASGTYVIRARAYREGATGAYNLRVDRATSAPAPAPAPSSSGGPSSGSETTLEGLIDATVREAEAEGFDLVWEDDWMASRGGLGGELRGLFTYGPDAPNRQFFFVVLEDGGLNAATFVASIEELRFGEWEPLDGRIILDSREARIGTILRTTTLYNHDGFDRPNRRLGFDVDAGGVQYPRRVVVLVFARPL